MRALWLCAFGHSVAHLCTHGRCTAFRLVLDQLSLGIRYFDLRAVFDEVSGEFRIEHLLLAKQPLLDTLADIAGFVHRQRGEFVVLYLSHMFNFTPARHSTLISHIEALFGSTLVSRQRQLNTTLFGDLLSANQRVLVLYDDTLAVENSKNIW